MIGSLRRGLVAGAAGTVVLNAVGYLDMALRGRPASKLPERVVDALAARLDREVPGRGRRAESRRTAIGALAGMGNGLLTGVLASVVRSTGVRFAPPVGAVLTGAAAMAVTDLPAAALGVTDPRTWSRTDWIADAVPHLGYGAAVQSVLEAVPTARELATPRTAAGAGLVVRSALLGVATGCRSSLGSAGPTLTAASSSRARRGAAVVAVGAEVIGDKRPGTPDRTSATGLPPRLLEAAGGAARLSARQGANGAVPVLAGVAGALGGSFGGIGWRRWAAKRMPDYGGALIEDAVALGLAAAACLPGRNRARLGAVPRREA
jgi:uncharacterized membrane protein